MLMEAGCRGFPKKAAQQQLFLLVICSSEIVCFRVRIMKLWTTISQGSPNWILAIKYLTSVKGYLNHQKLAQTPKCNSPVEFLAMLSRVTPCDFTPVLLLHTHVHFTTHTLYAMHASIACNPTKTTLTLAQIWYYRRYVTQCFYWTYEVYGLSGT